MTSRDDLNINDADFDAFLQRQGDLAQLLQELPQPTPSAQLDAAILAAAKRELETGSTTVAPASVPVHVPAHVSIAANDAGPIHGKPVRRTFVQRWRLPLGLAASLFVTVQLVRMQLVDERTMPNARILLTEPTPMPVAPETASPAQVQDSATPDDSITSKKGGPGSEQKMAAPSAAAPTAVPAATQVILPTVHPPKLSAELPKKKLENLQDEERMPSLTSSAPQGQQLQTPAPTAPTAAPSVVDGNLNAQTTPPPQSASESMRIHSKVAAKADITDKAGENRQFFRAASAPSVEARALTGMSEGKLEPTRPSTVVAAAPAAPVPAPVVAMSPPAPVVAAAPIVTPAPALPPAATSANATSSDANLAHDWLQAIDQILNAGYKQEALAEWKKFHKTYPDYPVPAKLKQQIKALEK